MSIFQDLRFLVEWGMLFSALTVAAYVCYTDIVERKIQNRFTYSLLAIGIAGHVFMVVDRIVSLESSLGFIGLGFLIGYLATAVGFWSAGDGKAFWAFTVALPPTLFPSFGVLSFNSALSGLLVNTIIAYLVFLGYMLIKKGSSQRVDDPEDESRGVVTIFVRNGVLLAIILVGGVLILRRPLPYLELIALLFLLFRLTDWLVTKSWWPMLGLCGIIPAVYIIYQSNSWIDYLLVLVCASVFEMIYQYLRGHLQHASVQSVRLDKLKPGDLLENGLRLSSQNIEDQRRLLNSEYVQVVRSIPFVPFLAAGLLLSAAFAGPVPLITLIRIVTGQLSSAI